MAVPTTRITDPNPDRTYRCARCNHDVPLSGYRLLYRGTKRPLRCRACEAATAAPQMARYYACEFERHQEKHQRDYAERPERTRTRARAWTAEHREAAKEYQDAWWQLNRDQECARLRTRYYANREERLAQDRARYAARHQTPEALTAKAATREQRERARRAAWRADVRTVVAAYYSVTFAIAPDELLARRLCHTARGEIVADARRLAIYTCWTYHRSAKRHPAEEIAAEYNTTPHGIACNVRATRTTIKRRHREPDGMDIYTALKAICAQLGLRIGHHGKTVYPARTEEAS